MPKYFNIGEKQTKTAEHKIEALPEPNEQYAKDFENYLQVLNRKPRTIGRRMLELAKLQELISDAKGKPVPFGALGFKSLPWRIIMCR